MTYKCPRCSTFVKDWEGDDPKCGFDENGNFLERNWCCATLTALREMAEENEVWCDDHYMAIVSRSDVGHGVLSWYKHRGQTDDFRDRNFERGTLYYAQQLLGDVEPACYSGWENVNLDDNDD
jgi:hypothetical protein